VAKEQKPIIQIKRIKRVAAAHHGGAWKIAYADFVTAMMAFFLLMWLIGSTAKGDLEGIAEYFRTPLKVALQGGVGSGDASHVIKGGGQDLTRQDGQVKRGDVETEQRTINLAAAEAERRRKELEKLKGLRRKVESVLDSNASLKPFRKQLLVDITTEGLRVQIVDEHNRPMFDLGGALLKDYTRVILRELAPVLNNVDNNIALSGHTDSTPYAGGERGYSNWELSADRANASRRELIAAGLDERKMVRVVGLASSVLLDAKDPTNPINRRISIVVLNRETEEKIRRDGVVVEVGTPEEAAAALPSGAKLDQ
jgi:chemotaxis protein MotB